MNRPTLSAAALSVWALLSSAVCVAGEPSLAQDADHVDFRWGVKIPMRDGVHLNATVYTPLDQRTPAPCIYTLTPYVADTYHEDGVYFAARGLAFAAVDARGRGNSEGVFHPLVQEAHDGYDIVEWLARQPYCNGKVAAWGYSYGGYAQWAAAKESPPHLATIAPAAALHPGLDFPMRNNIFYPLIVQWLTVTAGRAAQNSIDSDLSFWQAIDQRYLQTGRPFRELDHLAGNPSPIFQEWLSHPQPDAYWDAQAPSAAQYAQLAIPILTVTGVYDNMQSGALAFYRQHMRYGSEQSTRRHYLIIGPWDHDGTYLPKAQFGGLTFGAASLLDLHKLQREWYGWTLQGGPKPEFLRKRVAYYVMGAERWRYADTLEAVTSRVERYFLESADNAADVLRSGSLRVNQAEQERSDHYLYDPRDTSSLALRRAIDPASRVDQQIIYASGGKELVYHSAPFKKDTEISGFFKFSAWLSIDQADTDFAVSIYEIGGDGSSILLSTDFLRARYRESEREPKLIRTREAQRYDFNRFTFVSRRVKTGSRLRLVLTAVDSVCCFDGYSEKNYNSGGPVAAESMQDAKAVTVTLYHGPARPSALSVPVGQPEAAGEPPSSSLTTRP